MGSRNYKDLHIWQQSMELCEEVYRISLELPESEKYGIANQIQRCSVSVVSNIAEGANRGSSKDFTKFLYIAKASLAELETQLLLIVRIYGPIDIDQTYKKISRINQMFYKLIRSLNEKTQNEKRETRNEKRFLIKLSLRKRKNPQNQSTNYIFNRNSTKFVT